MATQEIAPPAAGTGPPRPPAGPDLGPVGALRWAWRRLTSMRTALLLLLLLALAAIPGSIVPQRSVDPGAVAAFEERNPELAPWLDRLGFFTVFSSPWFAAVYLLLFTSLVGCVLPRARVHLREWRARPDPAPARLERLATHRRWEAAGEPARVAREAARVLRRRWSVAVDEHPDGRVEVAARTGRLRETGNLVFHLSLIGVLVALAGSALYSWRGEALVVEGDGFANALPRYDSFTPGPRFDTSSLPPFSLTLDDLAVRFEDTTSAGFAAPRDFRAAVTVVDEPGAAARTEVIRVNDPLGIAGSRVFLSGNGYAPVVEIRDPGGELVFQGAVPFLPQDGVYTSTGVVKVPDAGAAGSPDLALQGLFLPTGVVDDQGPRSLFPDALDPQLVLTAWTGDLGLDEGRSASVFELDTAGLDQVESGGEPARLLLRPGDTVDLPDGTSVTFTELRRFAALDVRADPSGPLALGASVLVVIGLAVSLTVPRRRLWVRVTPGPEPGRTVVEVAGSSRPRDVGLAAAVDRVADQVADRTAGPAGGQDRGAGAAPTGARERA
ncbi:MAG: cytochrome c biogenesis protein ResB [Kineosporiaceae bacterium]